MTYTKTQIKKLRQSRTSIRNQVRGDRYTENNAGLESLDSRILSYMRSGKHEYGATETGRSILIRIKLGNHRKKRTDVYTSTPLRKNLHSRLVNFDVSKKTIFQTSPFVITPIKDLEITIERINGLKEENEEDEYGEIIIPTEYATQKAIELVSQTAKLIPEQFFKAWVCSQDSGGIALDWSRSKLGQKVRLVIPPTDNEEIYIYYEIGAEYGIEHSISVKTLSNWILKVNDRSC
jgi:hypothetical protein